MKYYHISELEQLSGIKAHTIRIWEKRYNLIEPDRTNTNIRMYDDQQVRKLLNVSTLLANGYKISKIAELKDSDIHKNIIEIQGRSESSDAMCLSYINDLVASMLDLNEPSFEKTFSAAVTRFGLFDCMLKVIYPVLHKIGLMWSTGDATPIQEHFASVIIRRKLLSATDGLLPPSKKSKIFLLMLPPDEWHEIGLLLSDYLIRSKGYSTINLGQNVPYNIALSAIKNIKITHVLMFFITRKSIEEISNIRKKMSLSPDVQLYIAGNSGIIKLKGNEKNTVFLELPEHLLKFL